MIEGGRQLRATLLFGASMVMGFTAIVNSLFSVPHLQGDMAEINVRSSLLHAVSLGLHFGTFAMFGFTLLVFVAAVRISRGAATPGSLLAIIAAAYVAFGATAMIAWGGSVHTLGYVFAGLLIGMALALPAGRP